MRSRSIVERLTDIKQNIALARSFVTNFSFVDFRADLRTLYATIRCLEVISEASRHLPDDLKARHPNIRWRGMAGAGSIYRHDYEAAGFKVLPVVEAQDSITGGNMVLYAVALIPISLLPSLLGLTASPCFRHPLGPNKGNHEPAQ